jgi:hypothetical protein
MMCGTERGGIPEGALELDPAALPLNLEEAASVVPESSSVKKGQEVDKKCAETKLNEEKTGPNCSANGLNLEKIYRSIISNGLDPNLDASEEEKFYYVGPDFFDFYQLRDASQFRANQIWAMYDSQGCMPRFYA